MTRKLTRVEVAGLCITQPGTMPFTTRHDALPEDRLSLTELVLIRRMQSGMSMQQAGAAFGMTKDAVNNAVNKATKRFGVSTRAELYKLPHVIEQLAGET